MCVLWCIIFFNFFNNMEYTESKEKIKDDEITLSWEKEGNLISYYLDNNYISSGSLGFEIVEKKILSIRNLKKLIIKVAIGGSLGGDSFEKDLPFADEYAILYKKLLKKGIKIVISYN